MNKKYEISVRADKKSVEQLKADLTSSLNSAFDNVDAAGKVKGLSRSDKAAIKADLSSLFGIADEQADALRKMVQGIIPSDTKSIDHMKSQLQDTLKFAIGIMEQMKLLGDSTDWMKQGVSFVDKFVGMQNTLLETQNVVSGIQASIDKLTESFKTFKDALAITNNDAYLKRFSAEAKLAVDDVVKAQEILNKASKSRNQKVKTMAIASDVAVTDYTDMSADEIREEYTLIIQAIKDGNAEIERLETQFKGKKKELYDSKEYQMQLRGLAEEVQNLQNLSKHPLFKDAFAETGTQISANLKAVTTEITNAAEKAGRELKEVIESLKGEGIEISVTLPDPDAAEFGSKISEFVTKASAQFKKKPIEISLDLSNPFKDAKKIKEQTAQGRKIKGIKEVFERHANEAGVAIGDSLNGLDTTDTSRIVQNLLESFNKVYNAVKTGQATITESTNQWRKDMLKALTLKATFDNTEAKAEVSAMMQELQNYLDENKPLYINTDTDELVQSIQQALNEAKFTVDVRAGNIDGSGVVSNVQIGQILNGLSNIQLVATDDGVAPNQQGKTATPSRTAVATTKNADAVQESTREQRILTDTIKSLQFSIDRNHSLDKMMESGKTTISQDTVKELEHKIASITSRGLEITSRKNEITRLLSESTDVSFVSQLRSEFKELEKEWARLYEQSQRLESQKRNIEIKLEQLADGESVGSATTNADKRQKENNLNTKRISAIQSVLDNNQSPATLVLNEVNKFWTQSSRIIERTEKEIAESTEALNKLKPDSEEYSNLHREIQKNQNKVDTWKNRQALMSQKGLVDVSGMGLEEAIQTLTDVLRKSPTLSDELLHSDGLKSLSSSKNIAYYANVAQEALGFRTQTEQEYVDEKTLQAKFVELFRINEFLKKVNSMFPKGGAEPDVEAVEGFINFFEKVPEMGSAVESAKKYLAELKNVAELQSNDEMFKTFKESGLEDQYFPQRAQELWGQMNDSIRTTLSQELSSRGIDAKNFANLDDASSAFEQMKLLYKEGVFDSVKSENADFQQLITLLKQSTTVDSTRKSLQASLQGITTSFEGRLRSVLFEAINTGEPISVKIVDARGNERVYDIHDQGRGKLDSDRSFSTNTKSLSQFLRISGLEKQMSEIVYAMFNDPDLAKTLIDNLFADGKVQLASKKNAFLPKSSQKYTFDETPLGQYIKNEEKNAKEREKLEAELADLKDGKYSESLSKRLEALPADKQTEAINSIIALKERQLASIQKLDLTEDQIAQSLVALADDIEITEAKMQKSQQGSRQSSKKAQRLLKDGTNSWTYQTAQKKAKNTTFDKDYNLKQLFSRIDIADEFGLMNTSVLRDLIDEYQDKQKEARELTDLNKSGIVGKDKVDAAWNELRQVRKTLIEEYYKSEGWYLTNLAQSQLETAENEIKRMNKDASDDDIALVLQAQRESIINGLKGKSDVQLMAEKYNTASANNSTDAQNEATILAEKKKQLKSLMEKYGVTVEMLEAERNLARVSSESVDAVRKTADNISKDAMPASSSSQGIMSASGFVGALNASNLATESTLRGLYEILNGGAPKGGWDGVSQSTSEKSKDVSERDISTKSSDAKFISSLTGLINRMSARKTEAAAFIGKDGQLGSLVEGQKSKVEASKISASLAKQVKNVLAVLHNHPTGLSALSQGDMRAAIAKAYGTGSYSGTKPVKVSGSIANGLLTSINFNGIDKNIAQQIANRYNELCKQLVEEMPNTFALNGNGDLSIISPDFYNNAELRENISKILTKTLRLAFDEFGHGDAVQQVSVKDLGAWRDGIIAQAQQEVVETIVESGAKAAVEGVKSSPNIEAFDAATTKELAQYISGNFKKDNGKNISGSRPLAAAMYDLSKLDIFAEGFSPTDVNSEQLAKAWSQLQIGMEQEVAKQLNDDIKAYIQFLQAKLQEIADANGLDYNAINAEVDARKKAAQDISGTNLSKESVEATKKYLGTFVKTNKKGQTVKQTGISRAQSGLKNVYGVLSNGRDTLTNANLKDLGTGYYQLVETINHEIFSKLNKETQQLLIQARDVALATLEKYGVKVYGSSDLQNQVISDDTKSLIQGGKVGHKFDSMTAPALVKTVTDADGNTQDKVLQKAQGRVVAEKAVTEEKKKQKKLAQEGTQQEAKATQEVQERATAEQQVSANKKKPKTSSSGSNIIPPSGIIKVPESGNNQGGILGLLGKIAQETTLQSVLAQLSKGVKTSSGGEGGAKSSKPSKKTDTVLSDSDALSKLQEKIKADYPEFASVSNSRAVSGGHAIDVFQYKNLDKIKEARADIARLNAEGKAGTEEWNEAQQRLNALLTEQEKITLKINTTTGEITTKSSFQNLAVGAKAASKELQNVDSIMSQLHDAGALSLGSDGSVTSSNQVVQNYLNSLRQLEVYKDSLSQDMLFDPSTQQQLSNLTLATQNYRKEVMSLLKATSQLNSGEKIGDLAGGIDGLDDSAIMKSMKDIVEQSNNLEKTFGKLTPVTNEFGEVVGYQLAYSVRTGKHEVQEMTASLNPLTNELRVQKGAVKEVATGWQQFFAGLKGKASSIMQYLISITSIHDVFRYVGQGVQYVRDIDLALTELKKVTDETDASYAKFLQSMSKTGSVIGATVTDLTTMAADWARLGYSMEEAGALAESTAILLNVSEFEDATTASEALISTMQAFQYTADESQHVVDILNEVGNNYAISSDGLATALQDSASSLMTAGATLEESVALIAAANKVVQDPNSVGSALRTISLRLRGTSVEILEQMGEETEGAIESTSKLQEKIQALSGVDILSAEGGYRNPYEILKDIAEVYDSIDPMDQAALIELIAGKNRANTLAAILTNFEDLENAYKSALNAEGSALKENEARLDSIQGRIDLFTNATQTMWMNFINSDVVKFIVDIGTGLIKLVDTVGVLNVAFAGLFAGMFAKYEMNKNNVDLLSLIFETIPTNIKNAPAIQNFASTVKTAFAEAMGGAVQANSLDILAELANFDDANNVLGDLANIFGDKSVTKDQAKQILDSFDDISDATKDAILSSNLFAASQTGAAVGTNILTASLAKAKAAAIAFGKGLMAFAAVHPIIAGLTAAVVAFGAAWAIVDAVTVSHDEYIEKLEEETEVLKSVQSELQAVQSELKTTSSRMEELQAKGTLSFVEEEELNRLKEQTKELERQEEILLAQEKRARNKQIETALNAVKTDPNENGSVDTKSSVINGIPYAASQQHDLYIYNNPYAAGFQNNGVISDTNKYESALNSLKEAKEDLEKAETELANTTYKAESKEYKKLEKAVEEAQGRVNKYNDAIDSMNETWQTEYGEIGYIENATTEAERQWNEYYRQHQDYLDQQALINKDYGKSTILDRVFGNTGTDVAQKFKKEFENAVKGGKDPSEVIEELFANKNYSSAFSGLEKQFGITIDNIKSYFTQTGEFAINPEFDITKYTKAVSSHSAIISEFQEAIQKLGKGSFTMDDFMSLIERFPDLAKGVDISSNAFHGLSRNLNKAIKTQTKGFVDDLKKLKDSLIAAGKSTDSIDQLIEAIENMPEDALDGTIEKYSTLADKIERARVAQDKLLASMEENPNEGYETRGEAMEYMKEAMSKGEIGSESNLWNVAEKYGFTYDSAKSINENADALAKFIATRERWFKTEDDGDDRTNDGYSYEGTENFIKDVEQAIQSEEFKREMSRQGYEDINFKWDYDETTGQFDFDFDNADWDNIVAALSKTKELAGLTSDEFSDLMIQVGQYFNVNWGDANDVIDHITKISEGSGTAADKIDQMTDSVETYVEKALGTDLDFSSLTQASIDALDCDDSIKQLLKTYLSLKQSLEDPLNIQTKLEETKTVSSLLEIKELQSSIKNGSYGYTIIDTDAFTTVLKEAGYTEDKINDLIKKVQEYQGVITVTASDPLGLNSQNVSITSVMSSLKQLGVEYELTRGTLSNPAQINITANDLITTLQEKGWTSQQIAAYLQTLTSAENGLGITVDGKVTMNKEEIDAAIAAANQVPEEENTEYNITGTGESILEQLIDNWAKVPLLVDTNYSIYETTYRSTVDVGSGKRGATIADGTAHAQGTAYNSGSWGAPQTETSLVGELGPELLVRGNRWTTVGENGAEFTQVKKGDIIFNHKQTESLLKNGYVTGRGRAYASGTAYASGGGTFNRYDFSGEGGYTKYDVNDNVVDKFGNAASSMSGAADDISDAADEFREVFDWIEVRLEEINEDINLRSAVLENTIGSDKQNAIIEDMIELNEKLYDNLLAGANRYYSYARTLLAKIPSQYREAVQNGSIAIEEFVGEVDEKTLEAIQEYRDWVQKGADATQQAEEVLTEISSLAKQAIDNISDDYGNKNSIRDSEIEQLEAYNSLTTAKYGAESANVYKEIIKETNNNIKILEEQRNKMQAELNKQVQAGNIQKYSQDWYDAVNDIAAVDTEIINLTADTYDYQDSINELHWDNFDNLMSRLEAISDEASNLIDILGVKDLVDDEGNWTEEGIATLGLYAQQMENAEVQAKKYSEEINYLNKNWESLGFTEQEYIEKLEELKSGQYDAIKSYNDIKDAIKDLTAERVDAIKEGIEKEIEAYEELINKKKEELDAEKDLHDFQKGVAEQQKEISDIERKIAALSADNSASARAKRAQLEAELLEAQAALEETYYDRSIQDQQDALDKELEHFQTEKEQEIEGWEEYLENTEQVVADGLSTVQANTEVVYQTLQGMGYEYSLSMSDALTSPWKDGETAIQDYSEKFGLAMSSTVKELEEAAAEYDRIMSETENYGKQSVDQVNNNVETYQDATKQPTTGATTEVPKAVKVGGKINAGSAKIYEYAGDTSGEQQYYSNDPIYKVLKIDGDWVQVRHHKLSTGVTGWFKKSQVKAYAKGSTGIDKDQLALIDELGDELVMHAGKNGRLEFMTKGSTVIPHNITENLMQLGELNPQDVLDRNRPVISAPHVTNNETVINIEYGDILHIDNFSGDKPADLSKMIDKAFDKHMKELNQQIRRYTR